MASNNSLKSDLRLNQKRFKGINYIVITMVSIINKRPLFDDNLGQLMND
ncbi:MAG: hypothetical protein JWP71_2907 [Mucilaginibacter sp.]|nr:hypothetical protein [Mucilaginibacter sp.]